MERVACPEPHAGCHMGHLLDGQALITQTGALQVQPMAEPVELSRVLPSVSRLFATSEPAR